MSEFKDPTIFVEATPSSLVQLEELQEAYRKAWGKDLPNSVELAMNAEEQENP